MTKEEIKLIRDLAEFLDLPVYHDGTWTITFGDSGAIEYTGTKMGIDNKKPKIEGGGILEFMAEESIPQLIGQALMNTTAVEVVSINPIHIQVFGLLNTGRTVALRRSGDKFERGE